MVPIYSALGRTSRRFTSTTLCLSPDTKLNSNVSPDGFLASSRRKSLSWGKQTLALNYIMELDFIQALKDMVSIPSI